MHNLKVQTHKTNGAIMGFSGPRFAVSSWPEFYVIPKTLYPKTLSCKALNARKIPRSRPCEAQVKSL